MKKILKIVLFLAPVFFSCAAQMHQPVQIGEYKWEQVLPSGSGAFPEEWQPGKWPKGIMPVLAFDKNLWMLSQKSAWSSTDGLNWKQYDKTDVGERIYQAQIFFNNKLWMFGGLEYQKSIFQNDIWFSADSKNWTLAGKAEWQPRGGQTVIIFKNKLWLFGGAIEVLPDRFPSKFLNDIWSSEDGIHWTQETASAPWSPRYYPPVIIFNNSLYMVGGQGKSDVWHSTDGKNWTMLTGEAPWKNRYAYGSLVFDNKMWVFGGWQDNSTNALNDIWYSSDGIKWIKQIENAPWTDRSCTISIVFKNKLWLFSGKHTGADDNWVGDIWTMSKVK